MSEPFSAAMALKTAITAAKALQQPFRLERARSESARLDALNEAPAARLFDEAITVLSRDAETLGKEIAGRAKGIVSQRPQIFAQGAPHDWILTDVAQRRLRELAVDVMSGGEGAVTAQDIAFYDGFERKGDDPDAAETITEALRFIVASQHRHLSPAHRTMLQRIEPQLDRMEAGIDLVADRLASSAFATPPVPPLAIDAIDAEILRRLHRTLNALDLEEPERLASARQLARDTLHGELSGGSPDVRAHAIAWAARLAALLAPAEVDELLEAARALARTDHVRVAEALCDVGDLEDALAHLAPIDSPVLRGGALRVRARRQTPDEVLAWLELAEWSEADLDHDGREGLLQVRLAARDWDGLAHGAAMLDDADFERHPDLLGLAAVATLARGVPDDSREALLDGVPVDARSIPMAGDPASVAARRAAAELYLRAAAAARERGSEPKGRLFEAAELWLRLYDEDDGDVARIELAQGLTRPSGALVLVPLALSFDVPVDRAAVARAIERERARDPRGSVEAARARLALVTTEEDPREVVGGLESHGRELEGWIVPAALALIRAEAVSRYDPAAVPGLIADARANGHGSTSLDRLEAILAEIDEGAEPAPMPPEEMTTGALQAEMMRLAASGPAERILETGRVLLRRTRARRDAELLVGVLDRRGQFDDLDVVLREEVAELVEGSSELRSARAWNSFRGGELAAAWRDLEVLLAARDHADDRQLRQNLLVVSGRWPDLSDMVDGEWRRASARTAAELLGAARLAGDLNHPRRDELVDLAAARAQDDAAVLAQCYFLAIEAGRDDEPIVSSWLSRAAALSGADGPVREANVEELIAQIPERRRRHERISAQLDRAELPMFLATKAQNRGLVEAQLETMLANRGSAAADRVVVPLFSGAESSRVGHSAPRSATFDGASLLTLGFLGQLGEMVDRLEVIVLAHSTLGWLFEESRRLGSHQPSQIRHARWLKERIGSGLQVAEDAAPDAATADRIGPLLAGIAACVARDRAEGLRATAIHGHPIHPPGSLSGTPVSGEGVDGTFTSCLALVEGCAGELEAADLARARTHLRLLEQPWHDELPPEPSDIVYLDDLAIAHLRGSGALEAVLRTYRNLRVSRYALADADELVRRERDSEESMRIVDEVRATLARALASGKAQLASMRSQEEDLRDHPSVASLLVPDVDVVVSDERFMNRHAHMERPDASVPIVSSLQLLAACGLDAPALASVRGRLRRAGVTFVPIDAAELRDALDRSRLGADGGLVEVAELGAIRESVRLAQRGAVLLLPDELPWLHSCWEKLVDAAADAFERHPPAEAAARADWLLRIADLRSWCGAAADSDPTNLARFGMGLALSRLSGGATERPTSFHEWLKRRFGILAQEDAAEHVILLSHLRSLVLRTFADALADGPPVAASRRTVAEMTIAGFPTFVQLLLIADPATHDELDLLVLSRLSFGDGLGFLSREDLHAAALTVLEGGTASIVDEEGRTWTLATNETAGSVVRLIRDDGLERRRDFFAIDPVRERRVDGFERAADRHGLDAATRTRWRERLDLAPLSSDQAGHLEDDLAATPTTVAGSLDVRSRRPDLPVEAIVPGDARYYHRLVGEPGAATAGEHMQGSLADLQGRRLAAGMAGMREATLVSGHSAFAALLDLVSDEDMVELAHSLLTSGDPLALVLVTEAALRRRRSAGLEKAVVAVVRAVSELLRKDGPVELLAALFILSDGEISDRAILSGEQPFHRRTAALANASLAYRVLNRGIPAGSFLDWAVGLRGHRFVLQTLVDMRLEPRWEPDMATPDHWRQEIVGRLLNAAGEADLPPGELRELLIGEAGTIVSLIGDGWNAPGPLEGAGVAPPHAGAYAVAIDLALDAERADEKALAPILNARRFGSLGLQGSARLVTLLERSRFLVESTDPGLLRSTVVPRLAALAAAERSTELAAAVRVVSSRGRSSKPTGEELVVELRAALAAAAAHPDAVTWTNAFGDWAWEIARPAVDHEAAQQVLDELEEMSSVEPMLRVGAGRALALLRLRLRT